MICKYLNSSLYKGARPNTFIFRAGRTEFPAMEGRTFSLNDLYNFCEKKNIGELTEDEITMYGRIKRNVRDNLRKRLLRLQLKHLKRSSNSQRSSRKCSKRRKSSCRSSCRTCHSWLTSVPILVYTCSKINSC